MFEYFKERRSAAVFYATLMASFGLLALALLAGQLSKNDDLVKYWSQGLAGVGVFGLVLLWRWYRLCRWRRLHPGQSRPVTAPLSRDEWVKARRKLAAKPTFKKR